MLTKRHKCVSYASTKRPCKIFLGLHRDVLLCIGADKFLWIFPANLRYNKEIEETVKPSNRGRLFVQEGNDT